jgi:1,2-diacylglycerol 3-alpha-glucosyltransferase
VLIGRKGDRIRPVIENPRRARLVTIWAHYGPYHLARVRALEAAGFDVIGYSYSSGVPSYEFFRSVPTRHRLINNRPFDSINPLLSWSRTLRSLWADEPELVLACGYERPETFAAVTYAKLKTLVSRRRPVVILMMDNQADDKPRHYLVELVKRRYLRLMDGFVVGGSTHIEYLTMLMVDSAIIRIGYNCVDNDAIDHVAGLIRSSGTPSQFPTYLLTLGRLVPKKNIGLVLHAYARYRVDLPSNLQPWDLVIAGDGPLFSEVRDDIARLSLTASVHMVGRVDRFEDVIDYYVFCRGFILASNHSEQWGLVVNEAMAAGVPVLVSNQCGCSSELVKSGRNGFTFDGNSVRELADRMLWLHTNESELALMGKESAAIIAEFSPGQFAENVEDLYRVASSRTRLGRRQPPDFDEEEA